MKKLLLLLSGVFALSFQSFGQGMAVNTTGSTAHSSAMLDVSSTTQGILVPRMTETQRTAINTPAQGLLVYQTDNTAGFYFYNGTVWVSLNNSTPSGAASGDLTGTYPAPTLSTSATTGNNIIAALNNANTGTIPVGRLGTGTTSGTTYLSGDGTWTIPAGGGGGSSTAQTLYACIFRASTANLYNYFSLGGATASTLPLPIATYMPKACTLKNLYAAATYVAGTTAFPASDNITVAVYKNGVATALSVTFTFTGNAVNTYSSTYSNTTDSVVVAPGDFISIGTVGTGAVSGTSTRLVISMDKE